jgi:hypothetical protein
MRAFEFLFEKQESSDVSAVNQKLQFVLDRLNAGEVQDPETIDFIYKILNKPQIKQAVQGLVGSISGKDSDVASFEKLNQGILNKILRKMPVEKEELDEFLTKWAAGESFVNTESLSSGNSGSIADLIPNPTAYKAFELFESVKSVYKMPKKGTLGTGEFGLAMLSPDIKMKAPGDIEVNGNPIEVKGNNARLYADERTKATVESLEVNEAARGSEPGLLSNVVANLTLDPSVETNQDIVEETTKNVLEAFKARGVDATDIINTIKEQGQGADWKLLSVPWWKAGFSAYQQSIKMPIMVIGFGKFYISDNAEDFIQWGCLPKTAGNYGYLFGRTAGQTRETYPKIFVPGHNK